MQFLNEHSIIYRNWTVEIKHCHYPVLNFPTTIKIFYKRNSTNFCFKVVKKQFITATKIGVTWTDKKKLPLFLIKH